MSTENILKFAAKARDNSALASEVTALKAKSPEELVPGLIALGEREGTPFTAEELRASLEGGAAGELSEADLSNVAGGGFFDDVGGFLKKVFAPPSPDDTKWVDRYFNGPR